MTRARAADAAPADTVAEEGPLTRPTANAVAEEGPLTRPTADTVAEEGPLTRPTADTVAEETARVLEYDTSWIGKEFDHYTYNVTKDEIIEFAQSIGETNPLYTDEAYAQATPYGGIIAPPTFCIVFRSNARLPDLKLSYGKRGFDGGKECVFLAPIRAGDTITGVDRIAQVYEKTGRSGSMIFIVRESELTNQRGEKVAVVRQSLIRRD